VARGIENMKKVKEVILKIAMEDLVRVREGRDVRKRGLAGQFF